MTGFFVNPFLWPFFLLAALPIALHLLSLRRLPTIELSTFRFLFDTYVQQRRRVKLLEYLLLLLRVLFLALLVFALMRPRFSQWADFLGSGGRQVYLLVDASASMQYRSAGVSSFDRGKEAALAVLDRLPPSDRVTLFRLTSEAEVVAEAFLASSTELRTAIEGLKPTVAACNLHAGLSTAMSDPKVSSRSIYLFTDLQKSNWKQLEEQAGGLLGAEDRLFAVNVGPREKPTNTAALGDVPAEIEAIVGQPVELKTRLGNFGNSPAELSVRIEVGGQFVGRFPIRLSPGKSTTRKANFVPKQAGPLPGRFFLEKDGFDLDDEFRFVLNVARPVHVLLVNGKPDSDPFRDEMLFLRAALSSRFGEEMLDGPINGGFRTLDAASLLIEETRDGEWNAERLAGRDVVVLANAENLSDEQGRNLKEFVKQGGGLLIFPGDRVHSKYRQLFEAKKQGETPLMPIEYGEPNGDSERRERWERLKEVDYGHPVFSIFRPADGKEYLTTPRFFRRHRIKAADSDAACHVLARFSNQEPAIVEGVFGKGIVVAAAFPVSGEWSTLPLSGSDFVPLMLRLVSYVRRKPELVGPGAVPPSKPAVFSIDRRLQEPAVTVSSPAGPIQSAAISPAGNEWAVDFKQTNDPGYYRLELTAVDPAPIRDDGSERKIGDDRRFHLQAGFAVNTAEEESDFTPITAEEVRKAVGQTAVVLDLSAVEGGLSQELSDKHEIWRWVLYLLTLVFVAEFFLATLRGPKTKAEADAEKARGGLLTRMTGVKQLQADD